MESESPPQRDESTDSRSHWTSLRPDPLLVACFAVLIAFPLTAAVAASGQPTRPETKAALRPATEARGPTLRDVPAFTPDGRVRAVVEGGKILTDYAAMRGALSAALGELFDPREREALESLLEAEGGADTEFLPERYPYRFPRLDRVVDPVLSAPLDERRAAAANDLGALLVLAAARFPERLPTAAPLAFAVLHRARAGDACLPQLNLGFLVATDIDPNDAATERELREAERRCPDDPTPLWLLGQYQSQRALLTGHQLGDEPPPPAEQLRRTLDTFARLRQRFPQSSAGWAGTADAWLRQAYQLAESRQFTLRHHYRRALGLYRRARSLDPDPALAAGQARAQAGLRLYAEAVRSQREALKGAPSPAPLQARLVEYLERNRAYGAAAEEAARLEASPRFPQGPALFMEPEATHGGLLAEDGRGALSLGSRHVLGVRLDVEPEMPPQGGSGALVLDLSFIPAFREVKGLTDHQRWCPGWLRRRDLLLTGRPDAALDGLPARFIDIRPETVRPELSPLECPETAAVSAAPFLAALAELERGNGQAALGRLRSAEAVTEGRRPLVYLHDLRQNLWRFAGDLDRARAAADRWMRVTPTSPLAFERAGEIAFLGRDHERAARLFGQAARLARRDAGTWSTDEAAALLKRGTALEMAGRYAEALAVLAGSDEVASRVHGLNRDEEDSFAAERAAYLSYSARLQMGDTHLRARHYAAALEQYEAARERERDVEEVRPGAERRRPEVLDNNQALIEIRLDKPGAGLEAAQRALRADRLSPIFLQTVGLALERAGQPDRAVAAYRAAVREEPTLYPAWNDLGALLGSQDRLEEAAEAFRRAIGVRGEYGLAWFNLGVALERLGLEHAAAAQGAFGRAVRADPELRGRERTFVTDNEPYFTTLDLSKPLPPKWEFARAQERAPVAAAGFAIALLLGLQLTRTLLGQARGSDAQRWLGLVTDALRNLPRTLASPAGLVAIAATVVVFVLPLLRSPDASLTSAILLVLGVGVLILIVLRSRVLIARREGVTLRQRGWSPGIVAGLGLAGFGLAWAPLPVAETSKPAPSVHWVGPIVTGAAAVLLLALGVALEVPATKAIGSAAVVMTASLLTPIEPLDGAVVARGPAGLVASLAALGTALFLLLGLS